MEAVAQVTQKRQTPETGIVLGSGKLEEASLAAESLGAECAVFDGDLTGSQIRNISNALGGLEVIDRTMLILEIFRSRAVTNEGKLQTELALLRYQMCIRDSPLVAHVQHLLAGQARLKVLGQVHLHKTGSVPQLVGKVAAGKHLSLIHI